MPTTSATANRKAAGAALTATATTPSTALLVGVGVAANGMAIFLAPEFEIPEIVQAAKVVWEMNKIISGVEDGAVLQTSIQDFLGDFMDVRAGEFTEAAQAPDALPPAPMSCNK